MPKSQIIIFAPTINYPHSFRDGLKILTFFAPTNNHCYDQGEGLETELIFISSTSFVNSSNPLDITLFSIETPEMGYTL